MSAMPSDDEPIRITGCRFFGGSVILVDLIKSVRIGQSHDFWRAYSLFVHRVESFAPERSEGANDATRDSDSQSIFSTTARVGFDVALAVRSIY